MDKKFVSRAGEKLEFALSQFNIDVKDAVCADLGCSTGGYTDCLLKRGAKKVYAVDTAYGELDWGLRNDERVVVMERTNALHVELPETVDFIAIDVAWTRQKLILPKAVELLKLGNLDENQEETLKQVKNIVSLVKPHYEAPKEYLRKGQLMEDKIDEVIDGVRMQIVEILEETPLELKQIIESPIIGKKGGNKEFLGWVAIQNRPGGP